MANEMISSVTGGLADKIFGGILWFGLAIIVIGIIAFLAWWYSVYRKKFNINVKVVSQRYGDKNAIILDKAAILVDRKTNTKYFRLWGLKTDLPVPKYNVLQTTSAGDYLELFRLSEDEWYFLTPSKIDKRWIIKADGKQYPFSSQTQIQVDPEMGFWAAKRKDMNKGMFSTESLLMKLLPFIPQVIGGVITIFILYVLMDALPGVLAELRTLVAELNRMNRAEIITGLMPLLSLKWNK